MQQLITDITAYNKVRQLDGNFRELDLMEVMDTVAAELNDDITEKGASLSYHDLPEINGIELLLKQLLLNLVRNSMKFSRPNVPPVVTVIGSRMPVALPEATAQRFYEVVVSDNGIGFDNSHAEEIFKVFTRLHSKQEFDGTGVGLSLCRKIMQHHKGYIKASGKPGEGATFMLYFPVSV